MSITSTGPGVTNRRRFIGAAAVTAASYSRILGANERIRIAGIGVGGRGDYLLGNVAKLEDTEIVGFCDVYEPHRMRSKARYASGAPDYDDYRKVLDRKDVDAVVIATPDHWHVPITIEAVVAGKDVYCEKPVTHTLAEGAPLIAAVQESKRVVQTGTQQRSWPHYMHAKQMIANGALGQVTFIRTYWYQNHIANQDAADVDPSKLDWKRFLGTAPDRPFDAGTLPARSTTHRHD